METIDAASVSACFAAIATHIFHIYVTLNGTVVIGAVAAAAVVVVVIETRTRISHQFHHYTINRSICK